MKGDRTVRYARREALVVRCCKEQGKLLAGRLVEFGILV